jgi:hypothetical protein
VKTIYTLIFILLTFRCSIFISYCQTPDWQWARSARGDGDSGAESIAKDVNGNVYITGLFTSPTINFGSNKLTNTGGCDIFLTKYDSLGNVLWAKSAVGSGDDISYSVATDVSGNVYITGWFYSPTITFGNYTLTNKGRYNIFLAKYDSFGNVQWAKSVESYAYDDAESVSTDKNGNVYITGRFGGADIIFGKDTLTTGYCNNVYIAKYDGSGKILWARSAVTSSGELGDNVGNSIATDSEGNAYITGYFDAPTITFGNYKLTNTTSANSNIFLAKYDKSGNVKWARKAIGYNDEYASGVATDTEGNVYITGDFIGSSITFGSCNLTVVGSQNSFLVKYDSLGNALWVRGAKGSDANWATSVATDKSNNVYITGEFWSNYIRFGSYIFNNLGMYDIFLVKYDTFGNVLWAKSVGGDNVDYANSVAIDSNENVYITGYYNSSLIGFGNDTITLLGSTDVFLAKLVNSCKSNLNISFITPDKIKCSRDSIEFKTIAIGDSITYQWYKDGKEIAWATNSTYIKSVLISIDAGKYSCIVSDRCNSISTSTNLTMGTIPQINDSVIIIRDVNDSLIYNLTPVGTPPFSYQWLKNDTNVTWATNSNFKIQSLKMFDSGTYSCIISNICGSVTAEVFTLNVEKAGVNELRNESGELRVYPNPANDMIIIETSRVFKENTLSIYNIDGQKLLDKQIYSLKTQINISKLSPGVYFVKLISDEGVEVKKLIVSY